MHSSCRSSSSSWWGYPAIILGRIPLCQGLTGGGWGVGLPGLLSVITGLIIQVNPYVATLALPFFLGIFGITFGFAAIVGAFMVRSAEKAA